MRDCRWIGVAVDREPTSSGCPRWLFATILVTTLFLTSCPEVSFIIPKHGLHDGVWDYRTIRRHSSSVHVSHTPRHRLLRHILNVSERSGSRQPICEHPAALLWTMTKTKWCPTDCSPASPCFAAVDSTVTGFGVSCPRKALRNGRSDGQQNPRGVEV